MKIFTFLILAFALILMTAPLVNAKEAERVNLLEEQNIEQKIQALSEEWQRHIVETVNHFLENELIRLRSKKTAPRESFGGQIEKYEQEIKNGSRDPETFISLARLYDRIEDGANAIINAKKAEKLFVEQKNVKGMAEARRSLRHYFQKYDYQPRDFVSAQ